MEGVRAVQMDNIRGLLGIRRMDRVPNARIRELYGVTKWVDERIKEGVFLWFGKFREDGEEYDCQENLCRRVCW